MSEEYMSEDNDDALSQLRGAMTDMAACAMGQHEIFVEYVKAGFTRGEALAGGNDA